MHYHLTQRLSGQRMFETYSRQGVRVVPSAAELILAIYPIWFGIHFLGLFGLEAYAAGPLAVFNHGAYSYLFGYGGLAIGIPQVAGQMLAWLAIVSPKHDPRVALMMCGIVYLGSISSAFFAAGATLGGGMHLGITLLLMSRTIDVMLHNGHST